MNKKLLAVAILESIVIVNFICLFLMSGKYKLMPIANSEPGNIGPYRGVCIWENFRGYIPKTCILWPYEGNEVVF